VIAAATNFDTPIARLARAAAEECQLNRIDLDALW
jgi:hypothetical protein